MVKEGVLYRVGIDPRTQEEVDQLIIPKGKREEALRWAHECPLGGHMREAATTEYWQRCIGQEYTQMLRGSARLADHAS